MWYSLFGFHAFRLVKMNYLRVSEFQEQESQNYFSSWQTNKMTVRPLKTQISLGIHPVRSESLLSAQRNHGSLATYWANSEDSDHTGGMPRLIWLFARHTVILLVLSWGGSFFLLQLPKFTMLAACVTFRRHNWDNNFCVFCVDFGNSLIALSI